MIYNYNLNWLLSESVNGQPGKITAAAKFALPLILIVGGILKSHHDRNMLANQFTPIDITFKDIVYTVSVSKPKGNFCWHV